MKFKKILDLVIYYALPIILLGISLIKLEKDTFNDFGEKSQLLLIFLLFIKPIAKISRIKFIRKLLIYRRQLGVASFWFFAFHAVGLWYVFNLKNINLYFDTSYHLFYGSLAAICMIILTITSNNWSIKKLKTKWKKIQYLAYPTLFLVLFHAALAGDKMPRFYIISILFTLLKILEWSKVSFKKKIV